MKSEYPGKEKSVSERERRFRRYTLVFSALAVLLFAVFLLNLSMGSQRIPMRDALEILAGKEDPSLETGRAILMKIRLPRILMALILGGALAVSGFLLQTFFANPIAGPFILGISSGAKMAVAVVMITVVTRFHTSSSGMLVLTAFFGALGATSMILLLSQRIRNMAALLVAGIMIGYICSAITDFLVTFAEDSQVANLRNWSMGSFSGMAWEDVRTAGCIIAAAFLAAFFLSKPMGAYQLGEAYAQSMGVNVRLFRAALILISSLLSAAVTAFAGPISFVGIAVPFLVRAAFGTAKPLIVIPGCFLAGAVFVALCDLIARMALSPMELNISTVTAIFGAPVVIFMMVRRRRDRHQEG